MHVLSQDGVFLLNGCCDPFNEKALRVSRGACFWVPIACGQWDQFQALAKTRKMMLYAGEAQYKTGTTAENTDQWHKNKDQICIPAPEEPGNIKEDSLCLILGNEGQGLSKEARVACRRVSIPMPGKFESLNVAVAGGILLYLLQKKQENM
ncbi:hypothetical protein L7F22_032235 [Adiantum nelumboides]|nr:hypothetical protein [Adiantum nelumboides]